jgi:hypothetical protein
MSNLLAIETAFLSNANIQTALSLREIRTAQRTLTNGQKKKFEQTLHLSKLVLNAVNWFNSEEGKAICTEEGISWTNEEIGNKVFGWQKSFFYKVVKAAKIEETIVETFKTKCDEAEAGGNDANRSLEGLLKFAKQSETIAEAGGNEGEAGGNEGEEGEETAEAEVEIRTATILTFTYKTDAGNVSVRIDEAGKVKTTNSPEQIAEAIQFLINSINQ